MRQIIRSRRPSHGTVVAYMALFVAIGGTTYAATGGNFILGQPNSATSTTALTAPVAGKALQVTNTGLGTGATALGLTVASGRAPFTVNSPTKVANLNADKLDDRDSSQFIQGKGSVRQFRDTGPPGGFINTDASNIYRVTYGCPSDLSQPGFINFTNTSGAAANLFWDNGSPDPQQTPIVNGGSFSGLPSSPPSDWHVFQLGTADGRFATVFVGATHITDSNVCLLQVQGLVSRR